MIYIKINIIICFSLIFKGATCNPLQRPLREFNPNKLMEKYMKLRTNIDRFGSYHPNDLIEAIHAFEHHKQANASEKSKQQLTGKGFDPNGQSVFAGSQLADWGFSYYDPNSVMNQYLGQTDGIGSFGQDVNGKALKGSDQDTHQKEVTNMHEGGFNPDKLNDQLMSSLKDNPFGSGFSDPRYSTDPMKQENSNTVKTFDPDTLNNQLMSILKNKAPMAEAHQIQNFGMEQSGQGENNTMNSFLGSENFDFQNFGKSSFNPDSLNEKLIGSLGYDATTINKETAHPVFSLNAFLKSPNSSAQSMYFTGKSQSGSPSVVNQTQPSKVSNQQISKVKNDNENQTTHSGYHVMHINHQSSTGNGQHSSTGNGQQEIHHSVFSVQNNAGSNTQQGDKGQLQNHGNIKHIGASNTAKVQATGIGGLGELINNGNRSPEITQTGNAYTSELLLNGYSNVGKSSVGSRMNNQSAVISQTGSENTKTVHVTGIGSLGVGLKSENHGSSSQQGHATGIGGLGVSGINTQQGLPGLNTINEVNKAAGQITQTGAQNTGKATGIGSLGVGIQQDGTNNENTLNGSNQSGQNYELKQTGAQFENNGLATGTQNYELKQTGAQFENNVLATGIGSLGEGSQQGSIVHDNLNLSLGKSNGSEILMQTITNNVENAVVTGIGGLGGKEGSSGKNNGDNSAGSGMNSISGQSGVTYFNGGLNVVGIGDLGGKSHFGNFAELKKMNKRIYEK